MRPAFFWELVTFAEVIHSDQKEHHRSKRFIRMTQFLAPRRGAMSITKDAAPYRLRSEERDVS